LLERGHFSPGEIDGLDGDNFRAAVRALQEAHRLAVTGKLGDDAWSALTSRGSALALKSYTLSDVDFAGPFTKAIPVQLEAMARLPAFRTRARSQSSPKDSACLQHRQSDQRPNLLLRHGFAFCLGPLDGASQSGRCRKGMFLN
jgi:Putative peptidoglycan binding domain